MDFLPLNGDNADQITIWIDSQDKLAKKDPVKLGHTIYLARGVKDVGAITHGMAPRIQVRHPGSNQLIGNLTFGEVDPQSTPFGAFTIVFIASSTNQRARHAWPLDNTFEFCIESDILKIREVGKPDNILELSFIK